MQNVKSIVLGIALSLMNLSFAHAAESITIMESDADMDLSLALASDSSSFEGNIVRDIKKYAAKISAKMTPENTQLLILTYYASGTGTNSKQNAISRAEKIQSIFADELDVLLGRLPIIPVAQSDPTKFNIKIAFMRIKTDADDQTSGRSQVAWIPHLGRFAIVCPNGNLLSQTVEWPDDFSAKTLCKQKSDVSNLEDGGSKDKEQSGHVVSSSKLGWDAEQGKWQMLCPDGTPLKMQSTDPDDFIGESRCANN